MLRVNNLSKSYKKTLAIDNISFKVGRGEVCVLLGPNGAGKSTTIQSIVGILRFDGDISIGDISNKDLGAKKLLAYVPEIPSLFPLLTVREHIEYMSLAYGKDIDNQKIDNLLKRFDLLDKQDKLGDQLSKGMMQKVSLTAALIVDPQVIVLDEPMIGLDPKAIKEIKIIVKELKDLNKTVLISTHMMEMVEDLWDRVIFMKLGKIVANVTRDDSDSRDLEALFFKVTGEDNE